MDFGELRVTYVGNPQPVIRAATEVDRINAQTARNAAANDRLVERSAKQLADVRTREAKRAANEFIREMERMRRAERQSSSGGGGEGGFGTQLSTLAGGRFAFAGGGALAGIGGLAAGFTAAAKAGVEYRGTIDKLTRAFEGLLGSSEAASRHLQELREFANRTPFQFEDVARASQRFQAMGIEAGKVVPLLNDMGNAVASVGGGKDELDRVALAIAQVNAKGRVMTQEMNQLSEVGISGWKALQAETGKTRAELTKMVEAGEVSADTFNQAFRRMYGSSNAMQKQMETLGGATSTLKDFTKLLLADGFGPFHDILRSITVELAKMTTEGFNASRAMGALASSFRSGFNFVNMGQGDSLLIAMAAQQGGPQLAAAVLALLRGGANPPAAATPPTGQKTEFVDAGGSVRVNPDTMRELGEGFDEAQRRRAEAARKAREEYERQGDVIRRISDDYAEASVRVTRFGQSELELEAALYKLSIGYNTLSEANKKLAQEEINRLFSAKAEGARLEINHGLHKTLTRSIDTNVEAMRGGKTAVEELNKVYVDWAQETLKATGSTAKLTAELDALLQKARHFARQKDFSDFVAEVTRAAEESLANVGDIVLVPKVEFKLPEGPSVDPRDMGLAPDNIYEEQVRRLKQMREVGEDMADIFSNVFNGINEGWQGMWREMVSAAQFALQDIARELMKMAFTGQRSGAGGLIGLAANWIGGALLGGLPGFGAGLGAHSFADSLSHSGYASGTMNASPGWHLVGERGIEAVNFRGGEQVLSNADTWKMLGGTTVINNTNIYYQPKVTPNSVTSRRSGREQFETLLSLVG